MSTYSRFIQASIAALMVTIPGPGYALEFPSTRDRGAPPRGPSLATRGKICLDTNASPSLTSLLPHNAIATAFGTDTDIPLSLWFHIPETEAETAELIVVNDFGDETHRQTIDLPNNPGTIQIALPTHQADGITPAFESSQVYYWDFVLICDATDPSDDIVIGGGIQRIDASAALITQLDAVADDPLAQAELYAAAGAWQETITLAAQLQPQDPDVWTELLSSVDLTTIAAQPIVQQIMSPPVMVETLDSQGSQPTLATPVPNEATVVAPPTSSQNSLNQLLEGIPSRDQE